MCADDMPAVFQYFTKEALCEEDAAGLDPLDPNRPRFTLQELRDVLHERNELKAKVFLLQEELAYYKRYRRAAGGGLRPVGSEETEDEIVTTSSSPSPELRTRSRSSAQPESGIKRLYVEHTHTHTHTHAHTHTHTHSHTAPPPSTYTCYTYLFHK
ncbi:RILP-like protein 1 [Liparis tanakae]|uniref:RILP-like protein 1 n=1 Tax=Liparis tanakae TaxID=230148 RepID=A0A4Z2FF40_9TELE|nr:RILP-like protein 1 [Liparis tanakae]